VLGDPPPALRTEAQEAAFGQGGKRLGAEAWLRHVERPVACGCDPSLLPVQAARARVGRDAQKSSHQSLARSTRRDAMGLTDLGCQQAPGILSRFCWI